VHAVHGAARETKATAMPRNYGVSAPSQVYFANALLTCGTAAAHLRSLVSAIPAIARFNLVFHLQSC